MCKYVCVCVKYVRVYVSESVCMYVCMFTRMYNNCLIFMRFEFKLVS